MGVTMVAQQKMTPGTGDPAQRKMMMMMPVVFTALFLKVSSGLALYFLFSNVFGMLFQVMVQRMSPELSKEVPKPPSTPKRNPRGRKAKNR
jgi:membrane protein insertase Oxa1/YidC/SpoIIIJ